MLSFTDRFPEGQYRPARERITRASHSAGVDAHGFVGGYEGSRSRLLALPDAKIRYWWGGSGALLVVVHGFGMEAAVNWYAQLLAFSSDFDVIAPDLPGVGAFERLHTNCIAIQVCRLGALLDDLGLDRVSLVGHSVGEWISLAFATYPGRVEHLAAVDAAGLRFDPNPILERALLPKTIDDVRLVIRAGFQWPIRLPAFVLRNGLRVARRDDAPRTESLQRPLYGDAACRRSPESHCPWLLESG